VLETNTEHAVACHLGGLQTLLQVRGLTKVFNKTEVVVRNVHLEVREGEVLALVGQSGSGKTTLAKCLVGLYKPEEGQIILEGQDLLTLPDKLLRETHRRVQLIFQDSFEALSPRLKVLELVREPLDIQRIGEKAEREERAIAALQGVRLPTHLLFLPGMPSSCPGVSYRESPSPDLSC
jgi:ABC-type glutathione transport system ATPase component